MDWLTAVVYGSCLQAMVEAISGSGALGIAVISDVVFPSLCLISHMKTASSFCMTMLGTFLLTGVLWSQDQPAESEPVKEPVEDAKVPAPTTTEKPDKRVFGKSTEESFKGKSRAMSIANDCRVNPASVGDTTFF